MILSIKERRMLMFSKLTGLLLTLIMFISSIIPSYFREIIIGNNSDLIISSTETYLEENFPLIKDALNSLGNAFYATNVNKVIPCTIINETGREIPGAYVDFNGNFGYIVISSGKTIYAYKCEGNLDEINSLDSTVYSLTDGFVYKSENGYVPYTFESNKPDKSFTYQYFQEYLNYASGDGSIRNPDEYIRKEYGEGFKLESENELADFDYLKQFDTSIYLEYTDDRDLVYSEGNCAPNALTSMFSYISKMAGKTTDSKFSALPTLEDKSVIYATEDPFFEKYRSNIYHSKLNPQGKFTINGYNYLTGQCDGYEVPTLYKDIRTFIIDNYGYEINGLAPAKFKKIVPYFMSKYGIINENVKECLDISSFGYFVKPQIDKGYPVLWSVYKSSTYVDHTTTITGYKIYVRTSEINGIKIISDYVVLLELNDNWAGVPVYFDYIKFTFGEGYFFSLGK